VGVAFTRFQTRFFQGRWARVWQHTSCKARHKHACRKPRAAASLCVSSWCCARRECYSSMHHVVIALTNQLHVSKLVLTLRLQVWQPGCYCGVIWALPGEAGSQHQMWVIS
jgi:hypothetical protein